MRDLLILMALAFVGGGLGGFFVGMRWHDRLLVLAHGLRGAADKLRARARALEADLSKITGRRA